jgi:hypothetical protein
MHQGKLIINPAILTTLTLTIDLGFGTIRICRSVIQIEEFKGEVYPFSILPTDHLLQDIVISLICGEESGT